MVLEIQFIAAGKKAFGLTGEKKPTAGGAVSMVNQQQPATPTPLPAAPVPNIDVQALEDENKFLRDQLAVKQQTPDLGNGNGKPGRPKKNVGNLNGFSSNGNGHKP